jgi:hypothetical protein
LFEKELGRSAEAAAFLWTMTGDNDNAVVEIVRNLIGSFDIFENHVLPRMKKWSNQLFAIKTEC